MNAEQAAGYIGDPAWNQWKLGLERIRGLLYRLGDPQKTLSCIHVAGTNGKGSFCAMMESILRSAGYRTGLYSSPFILDRREQIRVNGAWIPEEAMADLTAQIRQAAEEMTDHPSQFELLTTLAFLYFAEQQCDIVVLETGMGGLTDATNVIGAPELAVLTNIGLDHTDYLGQTLAEIARIKAGIIKPGTAVVCYPPVPEVLAVIRRQCETACCSLRVADLSAVAAEETTLSGQRFIWDPGTEDGRRKPLRLQLPLLGGFQRNNAALVLTAVQELRKNGRSISDKAVQNGLARVQWPARFEVLRKEPPFILDGGHNRQCAEAVAETLREVLPGVRPLLVTGMLADKDYTASLDALLPLVGEAICVTPPNPRALPAEELAKVIRTRGHAAVTAAGAEEAVVRACREEQPVLVFGSLYLAGEIRKALKADSGYDITREQYL